MGVNTGNSSNSGVSGVRGVFGDAKVEDFRSSLAGDDIRTKLHTPGVTGVTTLTRPGSKKKSEH